MEQLLFISFERIIGVKPGAVVLTLFISAVQEMHRRFENAPDSAKTKALQTVIEMKVRIL